MSTSTQLNTVSCVISWQSLLALLAINVNNGCENELKKNV